MFGLTTKKRLDTETAKLLEAKQKNVEFYKSGLSDGKAGRHDIDGLLINISVQIAKIIEKAGKDLEGSLDGFDKSVRNIVAYAVKKGGEEFTAHMKDISGEFTRSLEINRDELTKSFKKNSAELSESLKDNKDELSEHLKKNSDELSKQLRKDSAELTESLKKNSDELTESLKENSDELTECIKLNRADLSKSLKRNTDDLETNLDKLHVKFNRIYSDIQTLTDLAGNGAAALDEATEKAESLDVAGLFTPKVKKITDDLDEAIMLARKALEDDVHQILSDFEKTYKEHFEKAADKGAWEGAATAISAAVDQMLNLLDPRTLLTLAQEKDREKT